MYTSENERIPFSPKVDEKMKAQLERLFGENRPAKPTSSWEDKRKEWEEGLRLQQEQEQERKKYEDMYRNSIPYFMKECSALRFDPAEKTPSALLYEVYCRWCQQNKLLPQTLRSFGLHLKANAPNYQIAPTNFTWQGRHIRGYRGIAVMEEAHTSHP